MERSQMANTKLIPLASQPAYQEAVGKVAHISAALTRTTEDLERLQSQLFQLQNHATKTASDMDRALAIADGAAGSEALIPTGLQSEIERLTQTKKALQNGLVDANRAADAVAGELARTIAQGAKAQQVAAVKNILQCLEALCEANKAEEKIRLDLEKLGYSKHGLQPRGFDAIGRIDDWTGSPAYYFNKEAKRFIDGI
jgi:uncharacterized coiled-coil protein SlyX